MDYSVVWWIFTRTKLLFGKWSADMDVMFSRRKGGVMVSLQISLYIVYMKKKIQKYKINKNP